MDSESLADLVSAIRRGHACGDGESGEKLLIVIDHFEHWLHSHPQPAEAELTAALRQCDGVAVQCLLLVREEFRTPAARFLKELDLESSPSRRESLVDLFDPEHARRVLTAMGRSSQALPTAEDEQTDEHRQFLDHAVQLLEHDGRVVPAQLAMFVEYMRDKPWTAESLAALGGADSVAAAFFDDLLRRAVGSTQPGRALEMVAEILQALLPLSDTEYQRTVRTEQELFAVAGEPQPGRVPRGPGFALPPGPHPDPGGIAPRSRVSPRRGFRSQPCLPAGRSERTTIRRIPVSARPAHVRTATNWPTIPSCRWSAPGCTSNNRNAGGAGTSNA